MTGGLDPISLKAVRHQRLVAEATGMSGAAYDVFVRTCPDGTMCAYQSPLFLGKRTLCPFCVPNV
jgi:hypothetical protein